VSYHIKVGGGGARVRSIMAEAQSPPSLSMAARGVLKVGVGVPANTVQVLDCGEVYLIG
jgi:hypothetical protein